MFEFVSEKNMVVSQEFLGRFRPGNETVGLLKFSSRLMNDQFVGRCRQAVNGTRLDRRRLALFTDVGAFLVVQLLFFRPNADQGLSARFQYARDFFQRC